MTQIYYWLAAVAAFLIGLSKTGLPGVSLPAILLMAEAFPENAQQSVGAVLPLLLVGDVFAVLWYKRHAEWGRLIRVLPYALLGALPGVWVLLALPGNHLRPVIGWMVLGLLALETCRRCFGWERFPHQWWFVATAGILAGFTTFVANAAMPVMIVYMASQDLNKEQFIGTYAWFFFILNFSKVLPYCLMGMLTPAMLPMSLWLAPIAILGALLGVMVLARIPQRAFDTLALSLAGVAAVRLLVV
jgi:uncharacterized membrane protein YfcA